MRSAHHLARSRYPGRVVDLGTLDARAEAWDDETEEPAIVTDHGCLLAVVGRCVVPGHGWTWADEAQSLS